MNRSHLPYDQIAEVLCREIQRESGQQIELSQIQDEVNFIYHAETYETIRDRLFVRAVNSERKRDCLQDSIYREIGDIALILYIRIWKNNEISASSAVDPAMAACWDADYERLFEEAFINTYIQNPPRIFTLDRILEDTELHGDAFMDVTYRNPALFHGCGACLTNESRQNGAIAAFFPGTAMRLSMLAEDDLYFAFTSRHEVMVHCAGQSDAEEIQRVLRETIATSTEEDDILSLHVYRYDRSSDKFHMVDS